MWTQIEINVSHLAELIRSTKLQHDFISAKRPLQSESELNLVFPINRCLFFGVETVIN